MRNHTHRPKRRFPKPWYVYALVDTRTGKPFYIGITSNWQLRERQHLDNPCVVALCKVSMECVRIAETEEIAKRIERHLIRKLPGLVNVVFSVNRKHNQSVAGTTVRLSPIDETYQILTENVP